MTSVPIYDSRRRSSPLEVWRYRELLRRLVERNLKVKYQRSSLGFVWTLLNPLLTIAVLTAVFSFVVRIGVESYWAFLLSGYFAWNFSLQVLSTGGYILGEHAHLTRSIRFPSETLLLGSALARLVEFLLELVVVIVALVLFHHHGLPASFALLPVLVLLQFLLAVGLAMPIATLAVFFKDVQHALPILLTMLFYISPVFYPAELVPEAARGIYMLNPFAGLITLYHQVLYDGHLPSAALLGQVALETLVIAIAGYVVFDRHRAVLAEIG